MKKENDVIKEYYERKNKRMRMQEAIIKVFLYIICMISLFLISIALFI